MGASVISGPRLAKKRVRCSDGSEVEELSTDGCDVVNIAYSSVGRMVTFCAERGVSVGDWPIYYGVWEGDADLADIVARCERLRLALLQLDADECAAVPWLATVRGWLAGSNVFAAFE